MALNLVTGPVSEPVTLTEFKAHTRIDISDDDGLVAGYLLTAREMVEAQTRRKLMPQTWDYVIDYGWPYFGGVHQITLPVNPVISVTSITYTDNNGASQTLDASQYKAACRDSYSFIVPAYGVTWPDVRCDLGAVTVRFRAGYLDDSVSPSVDAPPWPLKQAILMLASHWYENRETVDPRTLGSVPYGFESLISPYRIVRF